MFRQPERKIRQEKMTTFMRSRFLAPKFLGNSFFKLRSGPVKGLISEGHDPKEGQGEHEDPVWEKSPG
jgi:hypothetical protein